MPWYGWVSIGASVCVGVHGLWQGNWGNWPLILALLAAACGDYFLANHAGRQSWYLAGITAFALTHILFAIQTYHHGCMHWNTIMITFACTFVMIMAWPWLPALAKVPLPLKIGGVLYLLISCLDLGFAAGRRPMDVAAVLGLAGVALLVVSDLMLVAWQFLKCAWTRNVCIPLYALSLLVMASSGSFDIHKTQKSQSTVYK